MAEPSSSSEKRPRVLIKFTPGPPRPTAEGDQIAAGANPIPNWFLELNDGSRSLGSWDLYHPHDIPNLDYIAVLTIEQDMAALAVTQQIGRAKEQIRLIAPDLPAEHLDVLTTRQLLAVGMRAFQISGETRKESADRKADAENPPDGERGSDSFSRSPLVSMAGATTT